jgi:hypothetical protein
MLVSIRLRYDKKVSVQGRTPNRGLKSEEQAASSAGRRGPSTSENRARPAALPTKINSECQIKFELIQLGEDLSTCHYTNLTRALQPTARDSTRSATNPRASSEVHQRPRQANLRAPPLAVAVVATPTGTGDRRSR